MTRLSRAALMAAILLLVAGPALRAADLDGTIDACDAACARFDNAKSHELAVQAVRASPGDFEAMWRLTRAQVDLGEDAQDAGRKDEAEAWFGKALTSSKDLVARHPGQSKAHYYRALALGRRALFAGGKEKVQLSQEIEKEALKAIELDPNNARAHGLIGRYYREMAHLSWVMRTLAETLYDKLPEGGDAKALAHLQKATELEPTWNFAWMELGETLEVMGRKDEARRAFLKANALPKTDHRDDRLKADLVRKLK